jgi:hypothetical protein
MTNVMADRRLAQVQDLTGPREASRARDRLQRSDVYRIDVHAVRALSPVGNTLT